MNETIDKKRVHELMDALGIRAQGRVWQYINSGVHYQSEVDELILRLKDEQDANDNRPSIAFGDAVDYPVYGTSIIEPVALDDMRQIARLPYVKAAAQMPDSHRVKEGHVPVGGVVVTHDCVLPGVVGNDIACGVAGTYFAATFPEQFWSIQSKAIEHILREYTYFGLQYNPLDIANNLRYRAVMTSAHNIMGELVHDESAALLKGLLGTIRNHFGTCGDGNHFIEIGYSNVQPVERGTRSLTTLARATIPNLAILSHFGSRGFGSNIADFYLRKANELNPVPKGMEDNAPLFFGTDMWAEDYWQLMTLAGMFAQQGHAYIHERIEEEMDNRNMWGSTPIRKFVHTTHNFAWAEDYGFIHRKGATPALSGQYANIPATMGDRSRIVVGLGNQDYLYSASHGAGRKMSRGQALRQGWEDTAEYVWREDGVKLIGGGSDEDPRAYKFIEEVMKYQTESVREVGWFQPMHVRMADPRFDWKNKKK